MKQFVCRPKPETQPHPCCELACPAMLTTTKSLSHLLPDQAHHPLAPTPAPKKAYNRIITSKEGISIMERKTATATLCTWAHPNLSDSRSRCLHEWILVQFVTSKPKEVLSMICKFHIIVMFCICELRVRFKYMIIQEIHRLSVKEFHWPSRSWSFANNIGVNVEISLKSYERKVTCSTVVPPTHRCSPSVLKTPASCKADCVLSKSPCRSPTAAISGFNNSILPISQYWQYGISTDLHVCQIKPKNKLFSMVYLRQITTSVYPEIKRLIKKKTHISQKRADFFNADNSGYSNMQIAQIHIRKEQTAR